VVGEYELTYSVKDYAGNLSKDIKRKILIKREISESDTKLPTLVLLGAAEVNIFLEDSFNEPGYNATDNKDGNISSRVIVTGTVDSMEVGTYEIIYSVADKAGNKSDSKTRTVVVSKKPSPVDKIAPAIELTGGDVLQIIAGSKFVEPGFKAIDDIDGDISSEVVVKGQVDTKRAGNYSLFYSVKDIAGNYSSLVKRTVMVSSSVSDNVPPQLLLFGSSTVNLFLDEAYNEPGFKAIDNLDGVITSLVEIKGEFNSSQPGEYELYYSVKDKAGNRSAILKRTLIVSSEDRSPPQLSLLGSSVIVLNIDENYEELGYEAIDNKDGNITSRVTVDGQVDSSVPGAYVLNYMVTDLAGNSSGPSKRKVIVLDKISLITPRYWWSTSERIGNGFYENWFGQFMPFTSGWIYHLEFGWVYVKESEIEGLWMWMPKEGWLWSEATLWPFIWANKTSNWIRFMPGFQSNFFFDYSTRTYRGV
jgi:hypothetical protein